MSFKIHPRRSQTPLDQKKIAGGLHPPPPGSRVSIQTRCARTEVKQVYFCPPPHFENDLTPLDLNANIFLNAFL